MTCVFPGNPLSVSQPENAKKLKNPMCLFAENSFHGGAWRCGFKYGTVGTPAVLSQLWNAYVVKTYMICYNLLQTVGWAIALFQLFAGTSSTKSPWAAVGEQVTYYQTLAWLEVGWLNCAKNGHFLSGFLIYSDNFHPVAVK